MIGMLHFATLVIATLFAAAAAVALDWMFLRAMFVLMQPATARQRNLPPRPAQATAQLARAYASSQR